MRSIQLLPYLMKDVFHGSVEGPAPKSSGDVDYWQSPMDKSRAAVFQILRLYPSFPQETRQWAESTNLDPTLNTGGPNNRANQMLRTWWDHNKDAVLAHRYEDATWLPSSRIVPVWICLSILAAILGILYYFIRLGNDAGKPAE